MSDIFIFGLAAVLLTSILLLWATRSKESDYENYTKDAHPRPPKDAPGKRPR